MTTRAVTSTLASAQFKNPNTSFRDWNQAVAVNKILFKPQSTSEVKATTDKMQRNLVLLSFYRNMSRAGRIQEDLLVEMEYDIYNYVFIRVE